MKAKKLMRLNAALFALVFLVHSSRVANNWDLVISTWAVPMWLSWLAILIVGYLGWNNYKLSK